MNIHISERLNQQLAIALEGTVVLGSISYTFGVCSVTALAAPSTDGAGFDTSKTVLSVLGHESTDLHFSIDRAGASLWTGRDGEVATVVPYNEEDFFKRTPFDSGFLEHLRNKKVMIIGLGSVGAPMGLELAKSGVGEIIAVDKDVLEIHNCMRHVLGTEYLGWPKPEAFAQYLKEQVPSVKCTPVYDDVFQNNRESLKKLIEDTQPTHILAVTDSLHIQYLCQLTAIHYRLPMMAVACDSNAVEGEIFFWEPGQAREWRIGRPERGCYACMRDPDTITLQRSSHFDYSNDDPDSYGGEPALGTFINRINNIAAIHMTSWLLRSLPKSKLSNIMGQYYDEKGLQYVRLGGPYPFVAENQITAKEPWAVEWYRVLKREECPFCSPGINVEETLFPHGIPSGDELGEWEDLDSVCVAEMQ